jgi:beta-galactosidase
MCYDLQLSMAPDKPIFEGEWHGLQTVYSTDVDAPAEFLDAALFYSYLRGVSANIMWWWSRRGLKTKGDWYYGSMLTLPRMLDAYGKNCIKAQRLAPVITAFKRNKPEVCIYYSETAAISQIKYIDALQKTYENLNWQGVRLGFVTTKMLPQADCKLLIVPGAEYLPKTEQNLLRNKQNSYITSKVENWDILFQKFGIERQYKCLATGNKDSFPVEFRYTITGKGTFFYLINLGNETVKVKISGKHDDSCFVDLLSGQNLTGTLTLPKYKLYILKKITK